jgi:hypothetical protein
MAQGYQVGPQGVDGLLVGQLALHP